MPCAPGDQFDSDTISVFSIDFVNVCRHLMTGNMGIGDSSRFGFASDTACIHP